MKTQCMCSCEKTRESTRRDALSQAGVEMSPCPVGIVQDFEFRPAGQCHPTLGALAIILEHGLMRGTSLLGSRTAPAPPSDFCPPCPAEDMGKGQPCGRGVLFINLLWAPCLFACHQAKASCESSALAPCESEGTDKGVDRIGIVVVDDIDGANAESPHLAMELEPLLNAYIQIEIVGEAELAWCVQKLSLFVLVIERVTRPVFRPITQE